MAGKTAPMDRRAALHRLVFSVTCRAASDPFPACLLETCRLLAAHYGASLARLYLGRARGPVATHDPEDRLGSLAPAERAAWEGKEQHLAERVRHTGRPHRLSRATRARLPAALGAAEGYGLPIPAAEGTLGALVVYPRGGLRITAVDLRALGAVGNVLRGLMRGEESVRDLFEVSHGADERLASYRRARRAIEDVLEELRGATGACSVLLVDRQARFVARRGTRLKGEREEADVLLAGGFEAARRLVALLGLRWEGKVVHESARESLFMRELGNGALLAVRCTRPRTPDLLDRALERSAERLRACLAALTEAGAP